MSCVLSQLFSHTDERHTEHKLKSYALDDKFYLEMQEHQTIHGWRTGINMSFSVTEAKVLKKQLEEFIAQNN